MTAMQKAVSSKPFVPKGRVQRFEGADEYVTELWNDAQHNHVVMLSLIFFLLIDESSLPVGLFPLLPSYLD